MKGGFFFESFNQKKFEQFIGKKIKFVQDHHSESIKGVLRGLLYQLPRDTRVKLVRVVQWKVVDTVVDVHKSSPTFGLWVSEILTEENKKQLWIPEGFAHGFLSLSDMAEFLYKTTDYEPSAERSIR